MPEAVIDIRGVSYAYAGDSVLQDVTLTVHHGDFLAVIGPNGGGKTTLIKCILGLVQPHQGSITVFGQTPDAASRQVGYVPQHVNTRPDFPINVLQTAMLGLRRRPGALFFSRSDKMQALAALERVDMAEFADRRMDQLSGGQRQRVFIARALVSAPRLLLLDEPTSNIDPHGKFCFYELLAHLADDVTILVVSHDLSLTATKINAVACINRQLLFNDQPLLTPDMLSLIYGSHDPTCSMGNYLHDISGFLPSSHRSRP